MYTDDIGERRSKPRVAMTVPATVRGSDVSGQPFESGTTIDNLSVAGLYVRLAHQMDVASPLFAIIRFSGLEIKAKGLVKRVVPLPDGLFGLGVAFESYRAVSAFAATADRGSQGNGM